eukprot:4491662-Ditylum_brightwellii.AAC.1
MEGCEYPIRPPQSGNRTIGSYAESLAKTIKPQRSYLQSVYNAQYDRAPIQHSTKRIMISTKAEPYKSAEEYNPNMAP